MDGVVWRGVAEGILMTTTTTPWHAGYTPPSIENMRRVGAPNWTVFVSSSELITAAIWRKLRDHLLPDGLPAGSGDGARPGDVLKVLDFGCGVGRVALQLSAQQGLPTHGCDIDASAIEYMKGQLPETDLRVTGFNPPLPYEDGAFDGVYSVSIWTHLSLAQQKPWLEEMARILRPGGLALITTSGSHALRIRHQRGDKGWDQFSVADLEREGILFIPYDEAGKDLEKYPGVTEAYGLTAHHPAWIRENWSDVFEVVSIHERAIGNVQDLCVLRKRLDA